MSNGTSSLETRNLDGADITDHAAEPEDEDLMALKRRRHNYRRLPLRVVVRVALHLVIDKPI